MKKDNIEDVEKGSEEEQKWLDVIKESYLEPTFSSKWEVGKLQLIHNKIGLQRYDEKRQDFLIKGRKGPELEENYGFMIENNMAAIDLLSRCCLSTKDSDYNALGYNRMGVYLCRHLDVCLQHALVKHSGSPVMRIVICKYIAGKSTTAIPRVASASEFIEPTQGFDSHVSVIAPNPTDSLQNQFDRSQVYLYEINKLLQPSSTPRQLYPVALAHFTMEGAYHPSLDAEATVAEKLSGNHRLQQIIHQINSKKEEEGSPTTPTAAQGQGLLAVSPLAGKIGPMSPSGRALALGPTGAQKISPGATGITVDPAFQSLIQLNGVGLSIDDKLKKSPPAGDAPLCKVEQSVSASVAGTGSASGSPLGGVLGKPALPMPNGAGILQKAALPTQASYFAAANGGLANGAFTNGLFSNGLSAAPLTQLNPAAGLHKAAAYGYLPGTVPGLARASPVGASRSLTPDIPTAGYVANAASRFSPNVMSSVGLSSLQPTLSMAGLTAPTAHGLQYPSMNMANMANMASMTYPAAQPMYGASALPQTFPAAGSMQPMGLSYLQPQLMAPKMAMAPTPTLQTTGLLPQTMVYNSLKRPLETAATQPFIRDKRVKYW